MKRLTFGAEPEMVDGASIAQEVMLLLARSGGVHGGEVAPPRVFECKTCRRRFPSFQALGGHRASHKRPRGGGSSGDAAAAEAGVALSLAAGAAPVAKAAASRAHGCAVCGMEFALGQALGGHMRRHRAAGVEVDEAVVARAGEPAPPEREEHGEARGMVGLDLNTAPAEDDGARVRLGLNHGLVDCL